MVILSATQASSRSAAQEERDKGHQILVWLFKRPIVSARVVRTVRGTTHAAANNVVTLSVELCNLREITGNARGHRFRYEPYVRLFSEDEPAGKP